MKNQYPPMIQLLNESLITNPLNEIYYYYLGIAYANTNNKNAAINCLAMALQINPQLEPANQLLNQLRK
jgi:predicted Zn-dependent protease